MCVTSCSHGTLTHPIMIYALWVGKRVLYGITDPCLPLPPSIDFIAAEEERSFVEATRRDVNQFSRAGLRTLVLAKRVIAGYCCYA